MPEAKAVPDQVVVPSGPGASRLIPVGGVGRAGFVVGVLGLATSVLLGRGQPEQLGFSYLVAGLFVLSLTLGALFFVLVQFVTRAGWSVVVRRLAEHVMGTLPVIALLLVPLGWAAGSVYPWAEADRATGDALLAEKQVYLSVSFFWLRGVVYLLGWSALAWWFRHRSLAQDDSGDPNITRRLQTASAPALVFFSLTLTFASFDWIMSLDPYWYSTIFGVYFFSGAVVGALALLVVLFAGLRRWGLLSGVVTFEHLHDLGKLLFGFVAFWAYIAFSQFMLIWYGNIPEETIWYAHRLDQGWQTVTWVLAVGHFVLPFFFLLGRDVKRRTSTLLVGGLWLLLMHYLDLYWLVMPHLHGTFQPHWLDAATLLGFTGIFLGTLMLLIQRTALIPTGDPRLSESLSFENM